MIKNYCFEISSSFLKVTHVAKKCRLYLTLDYFDAKWILQFESGLAEALNNIIIHAYQGRSDGLILIRLIVGPEYNTFEITDSGIENKNFNTLKRKGIPDPDTLPEGGWGLQIIQKHIDKIIYKRSDGINTLILKKYHTHG
jgi:serine/threonine-protein kinase RsbW